MVRNQTEDVLGSLYVMRWCKAFSSVIDICIDRLAIAKVHRRPMVVRKVMPARGSINVNMLTRSVGVQTS